MALRFGGYNGHFYFNDVWAYDASSGTWTEILTTGKTPQARRSHAAALVDGIMYVFGGVTAQDELLSDLAVFVIKSSRWLAHANTGNRPMPRSCHSMLAASGNLIVFGGISTSNVDNLVWTLDTTKIDYLEEDSTSLRSTLAPAAADDQNRTLRAGTSLYPAFSAQVMNAISQAGNNRQHQHIDLIALEDNCSDLTFSMATEVSTVSDVGCNTQSHARVK
jgi:outer membrane murein-binding lipoprotein Lpp